MSQLLETLLFKNGTLHHVQWHNERLNRSRLALFGQVDCWDLAAIFADWGTKNPVEVFQDNDPNSYFRCRFLYSELGIDKIEIVKTQKRTVLSLQLVEDDSIDYSHKWVDRAALSRHFDNKKQADDILIVKNGFLTDTYFANIVFWDGQNWITPATPLLKGTKRAQLLAKHQIKEELITVRDLQRFREARLINATTDIEDAAPIVIENIGW